MQLQWENSRGQGNGWPSHVWLSPWGQWDGHPAGTEGAALLIFWDIFTTPQNPATASVFKSVTSPFCAALSDRGCAVTIWTNSQNGSGPSNLLQLVIYDKQQCSISGFSPQWSDLVVFCCFLSKLLPILMVLPQVRPKWELLPTPISVLLARITPLLRNNWQS